MKKQNMFALKWHILSLIIKTDSDLKVRKQYSG